MKIDLFGGLNEEQKRAVETTEGPLLIQAGAGSGKTKALTHRIAYILTSKKATPYQILAVTFTNKAAREMRERLANLVGHSSDDRSFIPFMGTFHSICVRILRRDGQYVQVPPNFVIFDETDRLAVVKSICKELKIDEKSSPPRAIASAISGAKNELVTHGEFANFAEGPLQQTAAKVFPKYEASLKQAGALDFDDLIGKTVALLQNNQQARKKWQDTFKYILIDEYQDTNSAQYKLIKLLVNDNENIAVVGDDWQCLLPGTLVKTETGKKKIENIQKGETVLSARGYGKMEYFKVLKQKKFKHDGEVIQINTEAGRDITCTPNHLFFSRWGKTEAHLVYLMYSRARGYRIGMTKGTRFDGKKDDIGLRVRANQERADRMWVIRVCDSREEAQYEEALLAYKYGIPSIVFYAFANRSMLLRQKHIDNIYSQIDTVARAKKLMDDEGISHEYPHFVPQATSKNGSKKLNINIVLFGDKRQSLQSTWSASRISANTTNREDLAVFERLGYTIKAGRQGTFRTEIHNLDYGKIEQVLQNIKKINKKDACINKYAFITDKKFTFMPASQIHPGMMLPVIEDGKVVEDRVVNIKKRQHRGFVYDLDVDKVHNFAASQIVVHNSIYSWRGANFRNILNFERDYPKATTIKLEQNYRSTSSILNAAHKVIANNKSRSKKKLWTSLGQGSPVSIHAAFNERDEAETIIKMIQASGRSLEDCAVFYRTNAQSRALEEMFNRYGVPYRIIGGIKFYDRKEIKDLIAYLRLIYQPEDQVSFERIANVPTRGLGAKSMADFIAWKNKNDLTLKEALEKSSECTEITPKAKKALDDLNNIIYDMRENKENTNAAGLIDSLIRCIEYLEYLSDGTIQSESRIENVKELLSVARVYQDSGLEDFLEEVALVSDHNDGQEATDRITMMTLHSAKGLEFPVVFMVGMEESILPHSRAFYDANDLEEERRLCYVGMTRAKQELILIHSSSRVLYGGVQHNPPSRFLSEISGERQETYSSEPQVEYEFDQTPEPYMQQLAVGDRVKHQVFGEGRVTHLDGEVAKIDFKTKGVKKLNIAFASLDKLN